jgi:hypothetical protein
MKKILLKNWPFLIILAVVAVFFWKVFLLGQAPIPGDFIVGAYYPWLDYKWGYQVGVPVKNPITSDVVSIVYPLRSLAVDILKQGHLPLWNPNMFNGTPFFADFQIAVLSPTTIFYFFLPKIWAWTTQVMLQPLLAAIFMYLLLRNFRLNKIGSAFGGIFYAFSAFNVIWMEWNANSLAAAFIPLLILLLDKFISSKRLYWGVLLSAGICLQIFSGYPQVVAFTLITLFAFVFFRWEKLTKIKVLWIGLFIFAGFLLSSILTIPASEFILNSQRKFGLLEQELIFLPWRNLITFFAPDYFGNPATINYFGIGNYTLNAGYSGIVVFILALIGILRYWREKTVKFFLILIILALLLALPTPLAKFIFNLPIPAISASSNTRILVLANLALSSLAAFGISGLFSKEKIAKIWVVFIPLIILLVVLGFTFSGGVQNSISQRNLILPIGLAAMAGVLLVLINKLYKLKKLKFVLVLVVSIIATGELLRYGWKYTPFSPPGLVFPDTPVLTYLKNIKEPFRISSGNVMPMNMWVPYGLESVSGYDAVYPIWWARLSGAIRGQNPQLSTFTYYAPFELYGSRWFDLLNNEYLFIQVPSDRSKGWPLITQIESMSKFEQIFQDKSVAIFKNKMALPRAFFVSDWEYKSDKDTLAALINPEFPLGEKILINRDTNLKKGNNVHAKVSYDLYSPERSVINVETDGEGFLFVSDAWYPGWKATVDGMDTTIYRADYAFRAVPMMSGMHKVEFIYDPVSLKLGEALSLIALMSLAGVALYDVKKVISK